MKLVPVILAPRPQEPSVSTRRAILWMGMAFAGGTLLGGACGYTIGSKTATADSEPKELAPSGNAELDELRRLAVKAPIAELLERRLVFLMLRERSYSDDAILWRGVGRLCDCAVSADPVADRKILAKLLLSTMRRGQAPAEVLGHTAELERIAK